MSEKKYLAITKITCISHYTAKEMEKEDISSQKWDKLVFELHELLKKYDIEFKEQETEFLNKKKYSLCQCKKCNKWMVDREKNPAGVGSEINASEIIYNGATLKGETLCEMCLPENHRWAISSAYIQADSME